MTLRKHLLTSLATLAAIGSLNTLNAAELSIEIENLTNGITFTPFIIAAHSEGTHLFQSGQAANPEIQAIAEGGDISGAVTLLTSINADIFENPAGGLLGPGTATAEFNLSTSTDNTQLSIASMLLPTNDGFAGLDAWTIPTEAGTYTVYLNAYDSGTEANDEIVNGGGAPNTPGIPVAPGGDAGTGGTGVTTTETNTTVHIHRGVLGDTDPTGGNSDLDSTIHRWLNPVVKVTVTVAE